MSQSTKAKYFSIAKLTRISILSALSIVLFEFVPAIPVFPPIYKLDFSAIPTLLAGLSMGPLAALVVQLVKDLVGLFLSSSAGVGQLADFLMTGSFTVIASIIYKRHRTRNGALVGMAAGTIAMVVVGILSNLYILIPFYVGAFHMSIDQIVAMIGGIIPAVDSLPKLILLATGPFNLLKGIVLCIITLLIYKPLSPMLHGRIRN